MRLNVIVKLSTVNVASGRLGLQRVDWRHERDPLLLNRFGRKPHFLYSFGVKRYNQFKDTENVVLSLLIWPNSLIFYFSKKIIKK